MEKRELKRGKEREKRELKRRELKRGKERKRGN